MRITISHNRPKQEVMQKVDQSLDELFRPIGLLPLQLLLERRAWQGSTLNFAFTAKIGFVSSPIKGMIDVTDKDLTIDVDLGLLERLMPGGKYREALGNRVHGLLK